MSATRYLFVGGPWDGQVHELPDRRDSWRVPLVGQLGEVALYRRETFATPLAALPLMMIAGVSIYGNAEYYASAAVLKAIGHALGVEVLSPSSDRAGGGE